MRETDPTHWEHDAEDAPFLSAAEVLAVRAELAAEQAQRQEQIRTAIQEILGEKGPMLGTELYAELKHRFPDITIGEFRNARLFLGYPLDPIELFTLKRK